MGETETRVKEMLAGSHERLQAIIEQAKAEVCRIQTLDEVLGVETLQDVFPAPFGDSLVAGKVPARSLSPPKCTKPPEDKQPKKPERKKEGSRRRRPTIAALVEQALRANPGAWYNASGLCGLIEEQGCRPLNRGVLQSILHKLSASNTAPWLWRRQDGRKVSYSLAQSPTEPRPDTGDRDS